MVADAIDAGASGYLLKKHFLGRLFSSMQDIVITSIHGRSSSAQNKYELNVRQQEILTSLSKGIGYMTIAG